MKIQVGIFAIEFKRAYLNIDSVTMLNEEDLPEGEIINNFKVVGN